MLNSLVKRHLNLVYSDYQTKNPKGGHNMKKFYESQLLDKEVVLWEGHPEPFTLLEGAYVTSLITSWTLAALSVIAYIFFYIPYAITNNYWGKNALIISVAIGACIACVLCKPFIDKNTLEKKTTYILTNRRAIVVSGQNIKAMFIDANTSYEIKEMENGAGIILMGSAVKSRLRNSRSNTLTGIPDEKDRSKITGIVFYSVENADLICNVYSPFKK